MSEKLLTRDEYNKLTPQNQGYAHYMQADLPGSELKGLQNPYAVGSPSYEAWDQGNVKAMIDVQDCE